jgi:hypothetical protein
MLVTTFISCKDDRLGPRNEEVGGMFEWAGQRPTHEWAGQTPHTLMPGAKPHAVRSTAYRQPGLLSSLAVREADSPFTGLYCAPTRMSRLADS